MTEEESYRLFRQINESVSMIFKNANILRDISQDESVKQIAAILTNEIKANTKKLETMARGEIARF